MPERPLPPIVGSTEAALRALLSHALSDTVISGSQEWISLNRLSSGASVDQIADAMHTSRSEVEALIRGLSERGLVSADLTLTARGTDQLTRGRELVGKATADLTAGISRDDQEICAVVLTTMLERAEEKLRPVGG